MSTATKTPEPILIHLHGARLKNPLNGSMGVSMAGRFARAKEAREQRGLTLVMVKQAIPESWRGRHLMTVTKKGKPTFRLVSDSNHRCVVTITRIAPRALDDDNLAASAKHVRDGIADAMGLDDRDPRVRWRYAQRSDGRGVYGVEIRIDEIQEAA